MTIASLKKILPAPLCPIDTGLDKPLAVIEPGMHFPRDYLEFVHCYGSGSIADFISLFNPFTDNSDINFFVQSKLVIDDFACLIAEDPDYYRYRFYPTEHGLLPIGITDNGDYLFWVVSEPENSDNWTTAIIAARSPDVEYFNLNLTSLLEAVLSERIKAASFPESFPLFPLSFRSVFNR